MKKLIAISVVFALVAGVAFAVDLAGEVVGRVDLLKGSSAGGGVFGQGALDGLRLQGSAEVADGKFGGHLRFDPYVWGPRNPWEGPYLTTGGSAGNGGSDPVDPSYVTNYSLKQAFQGFAWWKPIDQFKLIIGQSNATDGFWGKEGNAGWGFNKRVTNAPDITGSGKFVWGGGYAGLQYRDAFANAYDIQSTGLYMEIKPFDMLGINIGLPMDGKWDKHMITNGEIQVDLNLAFGNIALTYGQSDNLFLYYGGSFGPITLDVSLSMHSLTAGSPNYIYFGAAVEYAAGAFGIRFRTAEAIPVKGGPAMLNFGVLPFFKLNDNMTAFLFAEIGMATQGGNFGFVINPYMKIGEDWGPAFYVGFRVEKANKNGSVDFALPIGLTVGF